MKTCKQLLLSITLLLCSTIAMAQNGTITINDGGGLPGDSAVINVEYAPGAADVGGVDVRITFDSSLYSSVTVPAACGGTTGATFQSCSVVGNEVRIQPFGTAVMGAGLLAVVTFNIDNAATPGSIDTFAPDTRIESAGGVDAQPVDPSTITFNVGELTVTAGPEPAYNGVAAGLTMNAPQQGDTNPTGSVTITNTGNSGTTLTGTCSLTGADSEISLTNGAFSVAQGSASAVVAVACDASVQGSYTNTVSCAHNGTNTTSPVTYPVTCEVGPPGAAIYMSNPAAGSTIEMTPSDVPAGATVADQVLTINNAATDSTDNDLQLTTCAYTGDAAITVGAAPASPIAPNGSSSTTFSCDTATIGDYNGTYTCNYSVDAGDTSASASYPVHCGVRAAGSELSTTPEPGSTLSIVVPLNGTGSTFLFVSEGLDEDVDASIDSCTLADGSNFVIVTALPLTVPSGGTVQLEIQGTDPADGSLGASDVLSCVGTDSSGTGTAEWDLVLTVQTAAIPTLSTWGLLAMFLTMLGFGGIVIRRKSSN